MMKAPKSTCFPAPGVYRFGGMHVDLQCGLKGAVIHYTTDGSVPTPESPVYNRADGLIGIPCAVLPDEPTCTVTEIRTIVEVPGMEVSDVETHTFEVRCPPRHSYSYELLRFTDGLSTVYCVNDFGYDRMYLVVGEKKAILFDAGMDTEGDLKGLVDSLCAGIPWECVALHGHPDHMAQCARLHSEGIQIYMSAADDALSKSFGMPMSPYTPIDDGDVFDLGGSTIRIYAVPGHTPGCLVAVEEESGWAFISDGLGNDRTETPDTGWMQFGNPESMMERYLSAIQSFRYRSAGTVRKLLFGHGYHVLEADPYLDNLEHIIQQVVDRGEACLVPSLRPAADSFGSGRITAVGNYQTDLFFAGANVGAKLFTGDLTPENNALLSLIALDGIVPGDRFCPYQKEYTYQPKGSAVTVMAVPSATAAAMKINGVPAGRRSEVSVPAGDITVEITSPDGTRSETYTFRRA